MLINTCPQSPYILDHNQFPHLSSTKEFRSPSSSSSYSYPVLFPIDFLLLTADAPALLFPLFSMKSTIYTNGFWSAIHHQQQQHHHRLTVIIIINSSVLCPPIGLCIASPLVHHVQHFSREATAAAATRAPHPPVSSSQFTNLFFFCHRENLSVSLYNTAQPCPYVLASGVTSIPT